MTLGLNFMASAGLKVLLAKQDYQFDENLQCLVDHSCMMAKFGDKNTLRLEAVLTTGSYKLLIIDYSPGDQGMLGEIRKPVSIKIQASAIMQNEER